MKWLMQLLAVCLLPIQAFTADSSNQPALQFRLVVENPTVDSEKMILSVKGRDGRTIKEELRVQRTSLLDSSAVKSAGMITNRFDGSFEISILLTDEGRKNSLKLLVNILEKN
jgi:hypothetical protein